MKTEMPDQHANAALFVWFSSGTKRNDRGSLMMYQAHDELVSAWYASFRKTDGWILHLTKGTRRDEVERLMAGNATSRLQATLGLRLS